MSVAASSPARHDAVWIRWRELQTSTLQSSSGSRTAIERYNNISPSYANLATREAGAVAEEAKKKKKAKYSHLESSHHFVPVAVESLGVLGPEARFFFLDLGRRLMDTTLEPLSHYFLLQRVAVAVQRGNTAAVLGTLESDYFESFCPT